MKNSTIIAITNSKGGVGKTTTALNLGAALTAEGQKVLLIDNDQQGSLTLSLGYEPSALPSTLANLMFQAIDMPELLNESIERTIQRTSDNLHLIPANKKAGRYPVAARQYAEHPRHVPE